MPKSTSLTKEYLDKQFKVLTKHLDSKFDAQSKEIVDLAGMTARGFRDVHEKFDAKFELLDAKLNRIERNTTERIVDHENRIRRTENALGITI